jgi:AmmeMemoRadiSam system protein A
MIMDQPVSMLTKQDKAYLLGLARSSIDRAVCGQLLPEIELFALSDILRNDGAAFVTLTKGKLLRGCIGALEAYQPLAMDVREHAVAAALEDYRFSPVSAPELPHLSIEISHLTQPMPLDYQDAGNLIELLRPGIDGVILADGSRRATFLPQVWEQLANPEDFLSHLCHKMGTNPDTWRTKHLAVSIYQVEEFHE